ncbi:MAG TPA: hypothetical protein VGG39_08905 [Polyangiaceae bacterium]|jgi:hypothetical protein
MRTRLHLTPEQRRKARLLAGLAEVDERTASKAIVFGIDAVSHYEPRCRLRRAIQQLAESES